MTTPRKRGKKRVKTHSKAIERKIFILVISACKSRKTTPFCVSNERLRRNTARRELRYFPQTPQSCKGRSSRTPWHFVPRDDAFALRRGLRRPCTPRKRRALYPSCFRKRDCLKRSGEAALFLAKHPSGSAFAEGDFGCGPATAGVWGRREPPQSREQSAGNRGDPITAGR